MPSFHLNLIYDISVNLKANISFGQYERTFILLKPETVQRGLIGRIIERFEARGFKLVAMKFIWVWP